MRTFTAKKIIKCRTELSVLFRKLKDNGYTWSSGTDLCFSTDTERCLNNIPILLAFDARQKIVCYSTYVDIEVPIDPNLT